MWTMTISRSQLVLKWAYFWWIVSDLGALGAGWVLSVAGALDRCAEIWWISCTAVQESNPIQELVSMDLDMVFNFDNMGWSNALKKWADEFAIFRERKKNYKNGYFSEPGRIVIHGALNAESRWHTGKDACTQTHKHTNTQIYITKWFSLGTYLGNGKMNSSSSNLLLHSSSECTHSSYRRCEGSIRDLR